MTALQLGPESPESMLARAVKHLDDGADPQRLRDVALAWIEKWARLVEEQAANEGTPQRLDGRASIYTGETYAEARDRWQAYLDLLTDHLRDVEGGLG